MPGHKAGQVMDRRFGCAIGERIKRRTLETIDRTDVDHPRRAGTLPGSPQQRQQLLGQKENTLDVGVHDFVPADFRKLIEGSAPGSAGVVHQNIQLRLMRSQLCCQTFNARQVGQIRRQRDALPTIDLAQALGRGLAGLRFT